ncbi:MULTISPECIES: hypothetical protein [unclassified Rhizobium]|uniref:hypothetical protein n=1 Tax=Rhizobium TaxID=379 RepID=UPI0013AEB7E9|nr:MULTISPECIES: hypothetical protein [unclassified Rhizobium]QYA11229.1 hypothetical protein J5284_11765 [Rhizobium sp. AB2/73]UEQ79240.1 hypothetical protein I8E17_10235 [Rhizobium sp. AB2/73]
MKIEFRRLLAQAGAIDFERLPGSPSVVQKHSSFPVRELMCQVAIRRGRCGGTERSADG